MYIRHERAHARDVTRRFNISHGPGLALGSQDRDYLESRPLATVARAVVANYSQSALLVGSVGIIRTRGRGGQGGATI